MFRLVVLPYFDLTVSMYMWKRLGKSVAIYIYCSTGNVGGREIITIFTFLTLDRENIIYEKI